MPSHDAATTPPQQDPNLIKVFDEYGRELFITKEQWRTSVLPGTLQSNWNNPDKLYGVIVGSLNDGFHAEVLAAAKHLYAIDPAPARGACTYGTVLMKNNRLDEAESVFLTHMKTHGEEGYILTSLAKVFAARNESEKMISTLWHALELDPNQGNGLLWYATLGREQSGASGWTHALNRVAALPHSWQAQIWLAREALEANSVDTALAYCDQALLRMGEKVSPDALMQISGDLGKHGHLKEAIRLTEPRFVPQVHGLAVGNNLIKAHLDLGQVEEAKNILDKLYALKRPDYAQSLSFWDTQIAKARLARSSPPDQTALQIPMGMIDGPVWFKAASAESELFPIKPSNAPLIAFLGSTAEQPHNSQDISIQIADGPGRMSRALPLFLAEQVWFKTDAKVRTLVPYVMNPPGGFVLSGVPWQDEQAADSSSQAATETRFVIVTHIRCSTDPWTVELRILRSHDHELMGTLSASFEAARPQDEIPALAEQLVSSLSRLISTTIRKPPEGFAFPAETQFPSYLLRLEQLLAARFATMEGSGPNSLNGEREILRGNLQLCVECPDNVAARLVLAKTVLAMKKIHPELIEEIKDKILSLNKKKPLTGPAQKILTRLFDEALQVEPKRHFWSKR